MRRLLLLATLMIWCSATQAQQTSLDLDFSDPSHADRFNFIFDTGGELTKSVADGEMKLELNKKEWHFFQVWIDPFAFIQNPYISFRIKSDKATPIRIWIKNDESEKELYNETIPASDEYLTVQLSFDDISPLVGNMKELGLDIGGYQVPPASFSANVYLDHLRLGEAAKPLAEVYGTTYTEDFSSELNPGWAPGEGYGLSKDGDALKVDINRSNPVTESQINKLPSLSFGGKVLDVSENPFINLDIKGKNPFVFSVIASDEQKVKQEYKIRVLATDKLQTISLDLSSIPGINLSRIEKFYFDFNRDGFFFNSTAWIDNIVIGGEAANLAVMDAVEDKSWYKNSGEINLKLTHIQNASGIELDELPGFIENASVSEIDNGTATLSFSLIPNTTGEGNLTYTLKGAEGYADHQYGFGITIEDNLPPTLDAIDEIEAKAKTSLTVDLTGLSDGNSTADQQLTFVVTSSDTKVVTGRVEYKGEGPYGKLILDAKKKGTATVTVTVEDSGDGNNSTSVSFTAKVYNKLNQPPTIDPVANMEVYQDAGPSSIMLTGISDGDKGDQILDITVDNSDPDIVKDVSIDYTSGSKATLNFEPVAENTGTSKITVTIKDNGGTGSNDGNDSTSISFDITVLKRPVTGYVATLEKSIEGFAANDKYEITETEIDGIKTLVFEATDKFYWDGVFMNLPEELDLSENPYLTMEIFPVDQDTQHWIWFYDVNGRRNDFSNRDGDHIQRAVAGQWNKVVFDYSGENDWMGGEELINNKRITGILFDMHNADFTWPPPPNYTGTFMIRNLRIGSEADFTPTTKNTINSVANQAVFTNSVDKRLNLSGISNGVDNSSDLSISIENSNPDIILDPEISTVDSLGNAFFIYSTGATPGKSTITLTVSSGHSEDVSVSFVIEVLDNDASDAAEITLDMSQKFQKMIGFGTFTTNRAYNTMYTELMGGSAMRVGLISNVLEPVNDNDDPNVLNMEALDYSAFDWDSFKDLKAKGVETFILTSWGPPAWMKTNLSNDYKEAGFSLNTDETTNRLDYSMYEEFAESMVLTVKAFQQKAGIDLEAIGLQNEPAFHEPYASAILDAEHFKELIKVVGARFEKEGINTRLYFAEHVVDEGDFFLPQNINYLNVVKNDPVADAYADIFAVHGYGTDGITPGQPTFNAWETLWELSSSGDNPKELWMTETFREYQAWEDAFGIAGAIYGALEHGNVSLWTQWVFENQMAKQGKPTAMLYAMSNFAKFIRPGHVRIASRETNENILATSFLDEETGNISIVILNKSDAAVSVKVNGAGLPDSWEMYTTAENRNLEEVNEASAEGVFLLPPSSVTTLAGTSPLYLSNIDNQEVMVGTVNKTIHLKNLKNSQGGVDGLRIALKNSDEHIVNYLEVSEVNADGTATITFSTVQNLGKADISVVLSDNAGNSVSKSFEIKVVNASETDNLSGSKNSLKVYPNPSNGSFEILSDEIGERVEIIDVMGRVVLSQKLNGSSSISTSGIRTGTYILKLHTSSGNKVTRILIE